MPLHTTSRRFAAAVLAATLCAAMACCGIDEVGPRATAIAEEDLPLQVAAVADCVTQSARGLLADTSTPSLDEELSDCAGTMLLNRDLGEAIRDADASRGLSYQNSSLVLAGVATGNALELTFYTQGGGYAEAGINHARVSLATCWSIVVYDEQRQPPEMSGIPCDEVLVARTMPTRVVPFEDLDLALD